jgi:very-short-patch-repair endonuclease
MQYAQWMAIARRQGGVISRSQLRKAGLSDRQIDRLIGNGCLRRESHGVLSVAGCAASPDGRLWRAVLATRGTLVGAAAAYLWQLIPEPPAALVVAVPPDRRIGSPRGVRVVRTVIDRAERTERFGLPVTCLVRTAFDHLVCLPLADATAFADRAIQQRWITLADVERRLTVRRRGNPVLRRVAATLTVGAEAESERRLHRLLSGAGVIGWTPNHAVVIRGRTVRIDVAFRARKIAIEIDGFAYHSDRSRYQQDRSRQNLLVLDGWTVLRFTWEDVTDRPDQVLAAIFAALEAAA